MIRGDCHGCQTPLLDQPGPVVMDRDEHRYHFQCWLAVVDGRTEKHRPAGDSGSADPA